MADWFVGPVGIATRALHNYPSRNKAIMIRPFYIAFIWTVALIVLFWYSILMTDHCYRLRVLLHHATDSRRGIRSSYFSRFGNTFTNRINHQRDRAADRIIPPRQTHQKRRLQCVQDSSCITAQSGSNQSWASRGSLSCPSILFSLLLLTGIYQVKDVILLSNGKTCSRRNQFKLKSSRNQYLPC